MGRSGPAVGGADVIMLAVSCGTWGRFRCPAGWCRWRLQGLWTSVACRNRHRLWTLVSASSRERQTHWPVFPCPATPAGHPRDPPQPGQHPRGGPPRGWIAQGATSHTTGSAT